MCELPIWPCLSDRNACQGVKSHTPVTIVSSVRTPSERLVSSIILSIFLVGGSGILVQDPVGASTATISQPCRLATPTAVSFAISMRTEYISPPEYAGTDSCSWHSTNPNCFVRSLAIRIVRDAGAIRALEAASAEVAPRSRALSLPQGSFFRSEDLPPGAAIMIDHLYVRRAPLWVDYSLSGRLADDGSHVLLERVATSAPKAARA